jgi:hypothetical protein
MGAFYLAELKNSIISVTVAQNSTSITVALQPGETGIYNTDWDITPNSEIVLTGITIVGTLSLASCATRGLE